MQPMCEKGVLQCICLEIHRYEQAPFCFGVQSLQNPPLCSSTVDMLLRRLFLGRGLHQVVMFRFVDFYTLPTYNITRDSMNTSYHHSRLMGVSDIHNTVRRSKMPSMIYDKSWDQKKSPCTVCLQRDIWQKLYHTNIVTLTKISLSQVVSLLWLNLHWV